MTRRVLVVDDDEDLRTTVSELLSDAGYDPVPAGDGKAALQILRSDGERCCLVLLDLMMPRMDGWQFRAEQMKDPALATIPVIVMTAGRNLDEAPVQVDEIVLKPLRLEALLAAVARYCPPAPQS
ncbi:MAG: response regulator [Sandaracinaceae bacterium]|jgi:CheY-like chemotaxis protein|nr:response regulator [Sandaracinaceae bacterium]